MSENEDIMFVFFGIFGLLVLIVVGLSTYGGRGFGIFVIVLAATTMAVVVALARNKSIRRRILAVTSCFFCIMLMYASIYHIIFLTDPSSFAFSTSIEEGKVFGGFEGDFVSLQEENEKLYVLSLLNKEPSQGFNIVSNNLEHRFDDDHAIKAYETRHFAGEYPRTFKTLEIAHGLRSVELVGEKVTFFSSSPRTLDHLVSAKDVEHFHAALTDLISEFESKRAETIIRLQSNLKGRPEWEFLDFCYFSAITMTTVGYGDMLPNSGMVRLIVMLQAISGVMFVGFSLSFLWPEAS